jgi:hypothetical protein
LVINTSNSIDKDIKSEKDIIDIRGKINISSEDSTEVNLDIDSSVEESDFNKDFIIEN